MLRRADSQDVTFSVYVHARDSLDPTDHWEVRLPRTPRPSLVWLVWTNLGPPVRTCPLVFRVLLFTRAVTLHFWPETNDPCTPPPTHPPVQSGHVSSIPPYLLDTSRPDS
jgi:hypothetical protein